MAFCYKCMRYLVFVFNFLHWLIGLSIVAIAIWLRVDTRIQEEIKTFDQEVNITVYVILGIGVVMTVLGFLGCCGAYQESKCLLGTFFACLLIIFLAEIGGGIFIVMRRHEVRQFIVDGLQQFTVKYNQDNATVGIYIDQFQSTLLCCSAENKTFEYRNYLQAHNKLPSSCCKVSPLKCTIEFAYPNCMQTIEQKASTYWIPIVAAGAGLLFIELLGMIFAMSLCCYLRYKKRDEYDEEEPFETEHLMF